MLSGRTVLAIDPGPVQSAYAIIRRKDLYVEDFGILENKKLIDTMQYICQDVNIDIAVEMIASYGMAVGATVFETCVWIGRILQSLDPYGLRSTRVYRKDVKMNLCGATKAKDANIRQAIIDRYSALYGDSCTKKNGMLYKVSKDVWAAIAVGLTAIDKEM